MEKEVEITWQGKPAKVKMRRWNRGGEKRAMNKLSGQIKLRDGKQVSDDVSIFGFQDTTILECLVDAPFETNVGNLDKLSTDDFDKLWAVANELNAKNPGATKKSKGQSAEKDLQTTQK